MRGLGVSEPAHQDALRLGQLFELMRTSLLNPKLSRYVCECHERSGSRCECGPIAAAVELCGAAREQGDEQLWWQRRDVLISHASPERIGGPSPYKPGESHYGE